MQARKMAGMAVVAMLLAAGMAQADITIKTVPVGNSGNAADTRYAATGSPYYGNGVGFGAVGYTYNIGKYEVTAGQYTAFLNAVAKTDPYGLYSTYMDSDAWGCQITQHGTSGSFAYDFSGRPSGTTEADWVNRPVNYVSWGDSARFANWLTNGQRIGAQDLTTTEDGSYYLNGATGDEPLAAVARETTARFVIPSEDEWYKAAFYDPGKSPAAGYWDYATRGDVTPGNNVASPDPGNMCNWQHGTGGFTIGGPYWRTEVGEFENSAGPYGTFDQNGNVYEWNESVFVGGRGARGGSWIDDHNLLASERTFGPGYFENASTGFRIALVPEPATLAMLALGGLAVLRRRGRQR